MDLEVHPSLVPRRIRPARTARHVPRAVPPAADPGVTDRERRMIAG
ncbi:hypothetical protein ACFHW2_39030 [Actinomadura sp. LOL_016]